jgi:hypothetical protein
MSWLKVAVLCFLMMTLVACGGRRATVNDAAGPDASWDREIGKCCDTPWDCATGHCSHLPMLNNLRICSKACTDNADCPLRSGCARIGDGKGGFSNVCLPCEILPNSNDRFCPLETGTFECWR